MGKKLTRTEWIDVKTALGEVPSCGRTEAWKKAVAFVNNILAHKSDIAREYDPSTLRFSVDCSLCKKSISVMDTYVAYSNGETLHYDCNMVYKEPA